MKGPSLLNQRLGTTHGGTGEARGAGGWVPDPPGHVKPGCALENESPAGRSTGGCQVVGAGPRPPELGRNWAQTEPRGGCWAPGPATGGGAGPAQGYFLSPIVSRLESFKRPLQRSVHLLFVLWSPLGSQRRWGGRVSVPRRQSQTTVLGEQKQVTCT
jgi:hypothetical protein